MDDPLCPQASARRALGCVEERDGLLCKKLLNNNVAKCLNNI